MTWSLKAASCHMSELEEVPDMVTAVAEEILSDVARLYDAAVTAALSTVHHS
jgi:hypothetical protein